MKRALLALMLTVSVLAGCREDNTPSIYAPGRSHAPTAGKRVSILDAHGNPTFKLRRLPSRLKVYDPDSMVRLGHIEPNDDGLVVYDARTDSTFTVGAVEEDFLIVDGYFRLERVEKGWAVMDASAKTIGYVSQDENGAWGVRDDYSSEPRLLAARNENGQSVLLDDGKVVRFSYDHALEPAVLLTASLEKLDPLARVVLGEWLHRRET